MRLGVAELAVIMIFGIPLAAIVGGILIGIISAFKGDSGENSRRISGDEARLFQEMNTSLKKMESRIESLETILLERTSRDHEARQY